MTKSFVILGALLVVLFSARAGDIPYADEPRFICFAEDLRGDTFWAVGYVPRLVQLRALLECGQVSSSCTALGCRPY